MKRKSSLLYRDGYLTKCACFCGEKNIFFSKPVLGERLVVSGFFVFLLFCFLVLVNM